MNRILIAAAALGLSAGPLCAATLVNGSMTGPTGINNQPPGWSASKFSPDTNAVGGVAGGGFFFDYIVPAPGESSDGGTWLGMAGGRLDERIAQTIGDFVIGEAYELSWEQFNSGATFEPDVDDEAALEVYLDGVLQGTGVVSFLGEGWVSSAVTIIPTAVSQTLELVVATSEFAYLNIDGLSLNVGDPETEVPVPAAAPLLLAGLAGIAALRRRADRA